MGMQGEMSLLGQVDCSSECCHLMSTLHPPGVSVCVCLYLGVWFLQMELGTTGSVQWACKADEQTSTNIDFL